MKDLYINGLMTEGEVQGLTFLEKDSTQLKKIYILFSL